MVEISSDIPFSAATLLANGPDGKPRLFLILKGAFDIRFSDTCLPSQQQPEILSADRVYSRGVRDSLREACDLVPYKSATDIAVCGHAHSHEGKPVEALDIQVQIGDFFRAARIIGDRRWVCRSRMIPAITGAIQPFTRMPLSDERAFGGVDPVTGKHWRENPVGVGFQTKKRPDILDKRPLPNLEDPRHLIRRPEDHPPSVCMGFRCRIQSPDHVRGGAPSLLAWRPDSWNLAHPAMQKPGCLKGNEEVVMVNLFPGGGTVRFRLPNLRVAAMAETLSGPVEIPLVADTLCLFPDRYRMHLAWRGSIPALDVNATNIRRIRIKPVPENEREM